MDERRIYVMDTKMEYSAKQRAVGKIEKLSYLR